MKCIRCGHDSKLKERSNRTCPKCKGLFAFEPGEGDKLTDAAFENAVNAVSANGQIRWGAEHLYYEVVRRLNRRSKAGCALVIAIVLGIAALCLALFVHVAAAFVPALLAGLTLFVRGIIRNQDVVRLSQTDFNKLLSRWTAAHGQPKAMKIGRAHV